MRRVALIVGSGISTELIPSVIEIVEAAGVEIDWLRVDIPRLEPDDMKGPLEEAVEAVESCGVGLKTRLFADSAAGSPEGSRNPNVLLRQPGATIKPRLDLTGPLDHRRQRRTEICIPS